MWVSTCCCSASPLFLERLLDQVIKRRFFTTRLEPQFLHYLAAQRGSGKLSRLIVGLMVLYHYSAWRYDD
jgi:hypothetical protein